jgi:hypothetical protein
MAGYAGVREMMATGRRGGGGKTHLQVRESSVHEDEAATEEKARRQVSGVRQGGDQRNRTHLPIMGKRRRA